MERFSACFSGVGDQLLAHYQEPFINLLIKGIHC